MLLSHTKKLRTDGVAAALQSGGACTLFAEAAGTADLPLPEFTRATKTALKKALPSFASQNNPLDVTGQAAVETDMFVDALSALAKDPGVGLVAFDAFPPRLPGETPWVGPGAVQGDRVAALDRRGVRVAVHEPARLHRGGQGVHEEVEAAAVPAGTSGVGQRDPRAAGVPGRSSARGAVVAAAREPGEGAAGAARGLGTGGRGDRRGAAGAVRRAPAEGGRRRDAGAGGRGRREDPRTGRGQGARARDPAQGATRRGAAGPARHRRGRGRGGGRAGGGAPRRREVAQGAGAGDGARPRGAGRRDRRRAVRRDDHDPARRRARRGRRGDVRGRAPDRQAGARRTWSPRRSAAASTPTNTIWAPSPRRSSRSPARPTTCATGITSLEANPLLVGPRGAVAVDALAEAKPPA